MTRWEYRTLVVSIWRVGFSKSTVDTEGMNDLLNRHGEEGWELVSLLPASQNANNTDAVLVLKRPVA